MTKYPVQAATQSMKVNRVISGATTVTANSYAIVNYIPNVIPPSAAITVSGAPITRYFGPGQSVPATFTATYYEGSTSSIITFSILSGVEFINTP